MCFGESTLEAIDYTHEAGPGKAEDEWTRD